MNLAEHQRFLGSSQTFYVTSMSLINLPLEIWDVVLSIWNNLREIVRFDCAICSTVYAKKAFSFPEDAGDAFRTKCNECVLMKLIPWTRVRDVFISHMMFSDSLGHPLQPLWEILLSHSGYTMESLTIVNNRKDSSTVLAWASHCLYRLRKLTLRDLYHQSSGEINHLLKNNVDTLESLTFEGEFKGLRRWQHCATEYPRLQVLHWSCAGLSNLCSFLVGCPNLMALKVSGPLRISGAYLASAIAGCCPLMQRLAIICTCRIGDSDLMKLATGCSRLEYLSLGECYSGQRMADAVIELPCLHALILNSLSEFTLLEIVSRGHSALRVIDTGTVYSYNGLSHITACLPQLIGLTIHFIERIATRDSARILEHCACLQHLAVDFGHLPCTFEDAVLNSLVACCPNLRALDVRGRYCNVTSLNAVLGSLPQLRQLRVPHRMRWHVRIPPSCSQLKLVDYMEMAEWMPERAF